MALMPRPAQSAPGPRSKPPAPVSPTRLAAIDIGSNSIHMVVAEALPRGGFRVLDRERDMVRLGKSALGKQRKLSERAMRDGLVALAKMTTLARLKGAERALAVATSAVREASNGEEFLARVRAQTGLDARVLSGEEEGRLIFRAVRAAVDLGRGSSVVVDVGGGSTEWITARRGELGRVVSLPLGSLRCAGALSGDPPSRAAVAKFRRDLGQRLERVRAPKRVERMVATSGTAVCVADLVDVARGADWKSSGSVLREVRLRELSAVVTTLSRLRRRQVAALAPVGKPRSESILAGAILIEELVRHAGVDRFYVSDRALREGLVLEALGGGTQRAAASLDVRRRQVLQLAERAEAVYGHGVETARLAVRLFDLTRSLHGLGTREREWLEYAALLHDLGYLIDYEQHQHHGYYLVKNAPLDAFDPREIEILAHLVRYHRGAGPKARHQTMQPLRAWQQKVIEKLTPILRIADALDRSHARRVKEIYCAIRKRTVRLEILSRYNIDLELDCARSRAALFERTYGRELRMRRGLEKAG